MYGYQMVKEIERRSEGYFRFREGTLYPALHRLERAGLVEAQWRKAESGPQRRYYAITEKGLEALREMTREWRNFTAAFNLVVR